MIDKPTLLLVDDDPEISWGVGRCLTRAGCSVVTCGDGAEAISILENREFDILVTDIQMPRLNGLSLIEWVARKRAGMRIVAITAFGSPSIQQVAIKQGAILYLEKPFDPRVLTDLISSDDSRNTFCGNVDDIDLFDYVQLVFVTMKRLVLKIASRRGDEGSIYIAEGTACHAECGELLGEDAFHRCLSFDGGSFKTLPWSEPEQKTIFSKGEFLLMEAARTKDEGAQTGHISMALDRPSAGDIELDLLPDSVMTDDRSTRSDDK